MVWVVLSTTRLPRLVDAGDGVAGRHERSDRTLLDPEDRVIDEGVVPRHGEIELNDRRAPGGDGRCLHVAERGGQRCALGIDAVEDRADHVEARREVWAAVPEEDAYALAHFGLQGARFLQG